MAYGFARHLRDALPNGSFIAFTGTPISATDGNTRGVFGEYVSVYDIQQAVEDGATVPFFYESRVAKLHLTLRSSPTCAARPGATRSSSSPRPSSVSSSSPPRGSTSSRRTTARIASLRLLDPVRRLARPLPQPGRDHQLG